MNISTKNYTVFVELSLDANRYKANDKLMVKFVLTNNSKNKISILKWNTPLDGINKNMFEVEHNKKTAAYLGKIVDKTRPLSNDFISLDPNASISTEFDLLDYYDIFEEGKYTIKYKIPFLRCGSEHPGRLAKFYTKEAGLTRLETIISNTVSFELLEMRQPRTINGVSIDYLKKKSFDEITFSQCSLSDINLLNIALIRARRMTKLAHLALQCIDISDRPSYNRYVTWFGDYDENRYNTVTLKFEKISTALQNASIQFTCNAACDTGTALAHVTPSEPYVIYLCEHNWPKSYPPLNRPGWVAHTIIHEMSHFDVVAATDDFEYQYSGSQSLAQNDPDIAIFNADNYAWFSVKLAKDPVYHPEIFLIDKNINTLTRFASHLCVNKPLSIRNNLFPVIGEPTNQKISFRDIMNWRFQWISP